VRCWNSTAAVYSLLLFAKFLFPLIFFIIYSNKGAVIFEKYFCRLQFVMVKILFFLVGFLPGCFLLGQQQAMELPYRELAKSIDRIAPTSDSLLNWFVNADKNMETDRYDSAEFWLNKIGDGLLLKNPTNFNFYYHSRQAEVFYYNDLLQLGLQQTQRALRIAIQLKDSLFLADAHNFLGLFYMNLEKLDEAESALLSALSFYHSYKKVKSILPLSKPYHIHGNLGEVYTKSKEFDKALYHLNQSILEAETDGQIRPQSLAKISMGEVFWEMDKPEEAILAMETGTQMALNSRDFDVALYGKGALALVFANLKEMEKSNQLIVNGNNLIRQHPTLNPYYTLQFRNRVVNALKLSGNYEQIASVQEQIMNLENEVRRKNNTMIGAVLSVGLKNENRLLQLEIAENKKQQQENKIRIAGLVVIIILMVIAGLYYRNSLRQKLKLASIREKISQNLHDDIGASISSLHVYGSIAKENLTTKPEKLPELLNHITNQSSILMENMNDMVWSMKTGTDIMTLDSKLKNYGAELLTVQDIHCIYDIDEAAFQLFKGYEQRKNILLFFKEAMNNAAKYSNASSITITFKQHGKHIQLGVWDNGVGFNRDQHTKGHGIKGMEARIKELNGTLTIETLPEKGAKLTALLPIGHL
jgi:signal transduction histidine kinase